MKEKQLDEMTIEELKIRAYDLLMLDSRIQGEIKMIQQVIKDKNIQPTKERKEEH